MCMHCTQAVFTAAKLAAAGKQSRLDTARYQSTRDSGVQVVVRATWQVYMEQKRGYDVCLISVTTWEAHWQNWQGSPPL